VGREAESALATSLDRPDEYDRRVREAVLDAAARVGVDVEVLF